MSVLICPTRGTLKTGLEGPIRTEPKGGIMIAQFIDYVGVCLFLITVSLGAYGQELDGCLEIEENQGFVCPGNPANSAGEFIVQAGNSTGGVEIRQGTWLDSILGSDKLFAVPKGYEVVAQSISPNGRIVLLTVSKPSCPTSGAEGRLCNHGRNALFAATYVEQKISPDFPGYYQVINWSRVFGYNSHVVGWHSWFNQTEVLFNGLTKPEGEPLLEPGKPKVGFAYRARFVADPKQGLVSSSVKLWDQGGVNSEYCFVGRMHVSRPSTFQTSCEIGQKVAITRRCEDEPINPENYSWYNTRNMDGTGGYCIEPGGKVGPSELVPVFKVYVVDLDENCQPINFDRDRPVGTPKYTGRYRHMGWNAEWGQGQSVITKDGGHLAYWVKQSQRESDPMNNCAGFETEYGEGVGNGADRIEICSLDANNQCSNVGEAPEPNNPYDVQGGAYFFQQLGKSPGLFYVETTGMKLLDLSDGQVNTVLTNGFGGYPMR